LDFDLGAVDLGKIQKIEDSLLELQIEDFLRIEDFLQIEGFLRIADFLQIEDFLERRIVGFLQIEDCPLEHHIEVLLVGLLVLVLELVLG
jgi:hypothetical protein